MSTRHMQVWAVLTERQSEQASTLPWTTQQTKSKVAMPALQSAFAAQHEAPTAAHTDCDIVTAAIKVGMTSSEDMAAQHIRVLNLCRHALDIHLPAVYSSICKGPAWGCLLPKHTRECTKVSHPCKVGKQRQHQRVSCIMPAYAQRATTRGHSCFVPGWRKLVSTSSQKDPNKHQAPSTAPPSIEASTQPPPPPVLLLLLPWAI